MAAGSSRQSLQTLHVAVLGGGEDGGSVESYWRKLLQDDFWSWSYHWTPYWLSYLADPQLQQWSSVVSSHPSVASADAAACA